jgi:putative FmdB family regulatory protein
MPRYDYECPECGIEKEFTHSIGEDAIYRCGCGALMRKQFTAPATHFKGGGWGGSYPKRTYKTTTHADVGTGEIGSRKTEEI